MNSNNTIQTPDIHRYTIEIRNGVTRHPDFRMKEPVNLRIGSEEQIAIVGPNAGGKSRLVDIIMGRYPLLMNEVHYDFHPSPLRLISENIKYISFRDSYGDTDGTYYYQQRWNQHDINEETPTAGQLLDEAFATAGRATAHGLDEAQQTRLNERRLSLKNHLYDLFQLNTLLDKYIIALSSGELRKFQLTKTLLSAPRILIMDNPFIGLDAGTRQQLATLLDTLTRETHLQVIIILSKTDDLPPFITHVVPVDNLSVGNKQTRADYLENHRMTNATSDDRFLQQIDIASGTTDHGQKETDAVLAFHDVTIRYGNRTILNRLNWTVRRGEKWALSGENGAGKSTLLSLVCADNPQSYACNLELFGKRRGTGESIWDIKKHIGYVSPEMHRAYLKDLPAIEIVASGLNDSVGLYVRPRPGQMDTCLTWMNIFGIGQLADRTFLKLSSGEQRLCLLARAFVKNPDLLILDEPLHGLDDNNRERVRHIIDRVCGRPDKTLIMVTHYAEELPSCITHSLRLTRNGH
ncbi:MAG: ATP-binding cassette domain-containing protein [Clostridium sp.]|nr:ATP-binding cassette domain-containing protein [Clostridium sp.]